MARVTKKQPVKKVAPLRGLGYQKRYPRNGKLKIEANASKRGHKPLVDYAEREHFRASKVWSIENYFQEGTGIKKDTQDKTRVKSDTNIAPHSLLITIYLPSD